MIAIDIPVVRYLPITASRYLLANEPLRYVNPRRSKFVTHCNGPIAAVVGGISALSSGWAIGGLLGGLIMAGGAAGILGGLTGNKTLMSIGSLAGLAGGFVTPDGGFNNPFTSGLDGSAAAKGASSVFDSLKETFGITTPLPDFVPSQADGIVSAAGGNDALVAGATEVAKEASSGGGILGSLGTTKDLLGLASGAAQAYQTQPLVDARVDNLEANTAATNAQTGLLQQRQENLQFQDTGNLAQVNPSASPYGNTAPGSTSGRYAVVLDGQVKYITQAEYAQLQAAKQANGQGLLTQGASGG